MVARILRALGQGCESATFQPAPRLDKPPAPHMLSSIMQNPTRSFSSGCTCVVCPPDFLRGSRAGGRVRRDERRAFTMMEVLVVLAILALLAGLAITNIGGIFGGAQGSAAQLFVRESMKAPLMTYRLHMGDFPSTAEGLQALIHRPATRGERWHGPYITEPRVPLDPWGEPYQYAYPGTRNKAGYDLWSKGPDKQSGTEDDIGNWDSGAGGAEK
jgi:general secretion pathway protein G